MVQMTGFRAVAYRTRERKPTITLQTRMPGQNAKATDTLHGRCGFEKSGDAGA